MARRAERTAKLPEARVGVEVLRGINLSFYYGAKIGVVGENGAGKSTLLRIMAGIDSDFTGEAWAADGARIGYLPQEPQLDESLDVLGNVMTGVKEKKAILDRYNELMMEYSDRISTSLGPGSGTGTWRTSTSPGAVKTAALLVVGMKGPPARRAKETNRPALLWQVGS